MTLRELLEKNNNAKRPYKYVKIGSATNFMYCGVPDVNKICEVSEQQREKLTNEIIGKLHRTQKLGDVVVEGINRVNAKEVRDFIIRNGVMHEEGAETLSRFARKKVQEEFARLLNEELKSIRQIEGKAKNLEPWIGLLDRKVKQKYKSIRERSTLIIIIEGAENGTYWTRDEYERGLQFTDEDEGD